MALTQSPRTGAGKVASTPVETSTIPTTTSLPSLQISVSSPTLSLPIKPSQFFNEAEDPSHHHHHHHHHHNHHPVYRITHKHIHNGSVTEALTTKVRTPEPQITTAQGIADFRTRGDTPASTSPEGRGRLRVVRRVARSSSEESTCSSLTGEKDVILRDKVTELVGLYYQTGEHMELARIARDEGISASLRRVRNITSHLRQLTDESSLYGPSSSRTTHLQRKSLWPKNTVIAQTRLHLDKSPKTVFTASLGDIIGEKQTLQMPGMYLLHPQPHLLR